MLAKQPVESQRPRLGDAVEHHTLISHAGGVSSIAGEPIERPTPRLALSLVIADELVARGDDRARRADDAHPRAAIALPVLVLGAGRRVKAARSRESDATTVDAHHRRRGPGERGEKERLQLSIPG